MQLFHPPLFNANPTIVYDADANDTNVGTSIATLGVSDAAVWDVVVQSGVTLGASSTSAWGLDFNGVPANSIINLINIGRIQGAGGDGGESVSVSGDNYSSGGGGGGAGTIVGEGGEGWGIGSTGKGADGTTDNGGAGGIDTLGPTTRDSLVATAGSAGGPALRTLNIQTVIVNRGTIYGGGGGGGGGGLDAGPITFPGGNGGDPGDAGVAGGGTTFPGGAGGAAGAAVQGNDLTWIEGQSSPNVEGAITSWP